MTQQPQQPQQFLTPGIVPQQPVQQPVGYQPQPAPVAQPAVQPQPLAQPQPAMVAQPPAQPVVPQQMPGVMGGGMAAFQGIGTITRGHQSNTIRANEAGVSYIVRIDRCEMIQTRASGQRWKNTLTVLAALDGGVNPHQAGEVVNTFFNVGSNLEMFQQNVKSFVAGVLNCEDAQVDENHIANVLGDAQRMAGRVTVVTTRTQASKSSVDERGQPRVYNVYQWSPQLSAAEIQQRIGPEATAHFFPNGFTQ